MALRRAVVVDRDPLLLARLTAELGRADYEVESLISTVGLTPDLLALSRPELLVLDAGLPGLASSAVQVICRSIKARCEVKVILSSEGEPEPLERKTGADLVLSRGKLVAEGAAALGLLTAPGEPMDIRPLIDEVLGKPLLASTERLEIQLDLFSESRLYVDGQGALGGVFLPMAVLPPIGQQLEVKLELAGRRTIEAMGEVTWHRARTAFGGRVPAGAGIRLLGLDAQQRAALERFLELREPLCWAG